MKEALVSLALVGSSAVAFLAGWMTRSHAVTVRAIESATHEAWPQPAGIDAVSWPAASKNAALAQQAEPLFCEQKVAGSTPAGSSDDWFPDDNNKWNGKDYPDCYDSKCSKCGAPRYFGAYDGLCNECSEASDNTPASPLPQGDAHHGPVTLRPVTGVSDPPPIAPPASVHWFRTLGDARAKSTRLYVVINDTATPPKSPPPDGYAGVILGSRDLFAGSTVEEVFQVTPPAVAIVEGDRIIRRQNGEAAR